MVQILCFCFIFCRYSSSHHKICGSRQNVSKPPFFIFILEVICSALKSFQAYLSSVAPLVWVKSSFPSSQLVAFISISWNCSYEYAQYLFTQERYLHLVWFHKILKICWQISNQNQTSIKTVIPLLSHSIQLLSPSDRSKYICQVHSCLYLHSTSSRIFLWPSEYVLSQVAIVIDSKVFMWIGHPWRRTRLSQGCTKRGKWGSEVFWSWRLKRQL